MKKHLLVIRAVDKKFFDAIEEGTKLVETRAATSKFQQIKEGDILKFTCGKQTLERKVKKVSRFKSVEALVEEIDFKKIMPFVSSVKEMKMIYYSFPKYQEKIRKFGLMAFALSEIGKN